MTASPVSVEIVGRRCQGTVLTVPKIKRTMIPSLLPSAQACPERSRRAEAQRAEASLESLVEFDMIPKEQAGNVIPVASLTAPLRPSAEWY